jgi:hypothetical protein
MKKNSALYIGFSLMIIQTIICDRYRNIKIKLHNEKIYNLLNKKLKWFKSLFWKKKHIVNK